MIGLGWKQQRRKKQGVNDIQRIYSSIDDRLADILYVMVENVVTAYKLRPIQKPDKLSHRRIVKRTSVPLDTSDIKNFPALRFNFGINECYWVHLSISKFFRLASQLYIKSCL